MAVSMGDESEVQPGLSGSDAAEREGAYMVSADGEKIPATREVARFLDQDTSGGG